MLKKLQEKLKEFDEKFPIELFLNGYESSVFDEDIISFREEIKKFIREVIEEKLNE